MCKKLLSNKYTEEDVHSYGKLELYQKIAVGQSIRIGTPISMTEAAQRTRKARIQPRRSSEIGSYYAMMARCYNLNDGSYYNYGAKGIKVCPEWKNNLAQFLLDMGLKPEPKAKHAIDRIDPTRDYTPNNCRWIHVSENSRRIRKNGA